MKLDLGSGYAKQPGFYSLDARSCCNPDGVCNIGFEPLPFGDCTVDEVRAFDFLEHVQRDKTIYVMDEIWRVLKPGGIFESLTPDAEHGQGFFQDPTHVNPWCENSWLYYSMPHLRALYDIKAHFEIEKFERRELQAAHMPRVFHLYVIARAIK